MAFESVNQIYNRMLRHKIEVRARGLPTVCCNLCGTLSSVFPDLPQTAECEGCGSVMRIATEGSRQTVTLITLGSRYRANRS